MSAIVNWFSAPSEDAQPDAVELETHGEAANDPHLEQQAKLLPDMTDEEIERMKLEKAKVVKRQQVCVGI